MISRHSAYKSNALRFLIQIGSKRACLDRLPAEIGFSAQ